MTPYTGYLHLTFKPNGDGGRTVIKDAVIQGAFKASRPMYLHDSPEIYVYLIHVGGGYLNGDRYHLEFLLERDAQAVLTTQSATKIYRTPTQPAQQTLVIHLQSGSYLELIPDSTIAFQDAAFHQRTEIHMESDATLLYSEIFTGGWSSSGKPFQYKEIRSRTTIWLDNDVSFLDNLRLTPDTNQLSIGFMDSYTHFGTLIAIHAHITTTFLNGLLERLDAIGVSGQFALSELAVPGFSMRMLAHSTQAIEEIFQHCRDYMRGQLLRKEPVQLRKY